MKLWPFKRGSKDGRAGARPYQGNPGKVPPDAMQDAGLSGSAWEDQLSRAMTPQEAESVLSAAMGGDLSEQQRLLNSMADTWGMLSTCDAVVGDAVVGAPFEVLPYTDGESDATPSAMERRDLVEAAFLGMRPDPKKQEKDRDGLLKALARGNMAGHQVMEILWERRTWRGQPAILPRAVRRSGAAYYGYAGGGTELRYRPGRGAGLTDFPDNKFLIHVCPAHSGHPSQGGRFRVLAKYWAGAMYGWEWLLTYTNKFGMPFRWLTYKKESAQIKAQLLAMLANLGNAGYGVFPEGTKLELHEASKGSGELPQPLLMKLADQACELVMLGEVQSSGRDGKTGLSSGEAQSTVRRDRLQGNCNDVVTTLQQFARAVCILNYGNDDECPMFACEIPEPEDAKVNAETDEILLRMGMPIKLEELQGRHDKAAPAPGDTVIINGQLVKWADTLVKTEVEGKTQTPNPQDPKAGKSLSAAKAKDLTLADVMERLLINAVIDGADDFEEQAAEADAREDEPMKTGNQ